jgi:hypothetical protein
MARSVFSGVFDRVRSFLPTALREDVENLHRSLAFVGKPSPEEVRNDPGQVYGCRNDAPLRARTRLGEPPARRALAAGARLPRLIGLAGRTAPQPGLHHLPGGEADPARPARPTGGWPCSIAPSTAAGADRRRPDAVAAYPLPAVALREPGPRRTPRGGNRIYFPRVGYTTGDLDVHDVAVEGAAASSSSTPGSAAWRRSTTGPASPTPLWRPPFLSKLAPQDRCHRNGLDLEDGKARYVTAVSTGDTADGWRDRRRRRGVVMDVQSNEIVATGLSMPTRRASTAATSGCSTPAPAPSAASTWQAAGSSR